jgi:ketosteroid isomerase-like protein
MGSTMRRILCAVWAAAFVLHAGSAAASDTSEALGVVQKFLAAANKGNRQAYTSYCAEDAVIVDHVPPYVFRGPKACDDDWTAADLWMTKHGYAFGEVRLSKPYVETMGDRVYAAYPLKASVTRKGKTEIETAVWTFVLQRHSQRWLIEGWSWSTLKLAPVNAKQ